MWEMPTPFKVQAATSSASGQAHSSVTASNGLGFCDIKNTHVIRIGPGALPPHASEIQKCQLGLELRHTVDRAGRITGVGRPGAGQVHHVTETTITKACTGKQTFCVSQRRAHAVAEEAARC